MRVKDQFVKILLLAFLAIRRKFNYTEMLKYGELL
jgi:hypothetical protein